MLRHKNSKIKYREKIGRIMHTYALHNTTRAR